MPRRAHFFILIVALFAPLHALAAEDASPDTLREAIKQCQTKSLPDERLKCFDSTADTTLGPAFAAPQSDGTWQIERSRSAVDGSVTVLAALKAADMNLPYPAQEGPQYFVVRCREGKTEAYFYLGYWYYPLFYWPWPSPNYIRTYYAFDRELPVETHWNHSRNAQAWGPWASGETIPFLKRAMEARSLKISFGGPQYVELGFNLTGAAAAIQAVREACKW
jgi:hypothetical protein